MRMLQRQAGGQVGRAAVMRSVWRSTCVLVNQRAHSVDRANAACEYKNNREAYIRCIINFKSSFHQINADEWAGENGTKSEA